MIAFSILLIAILIVAIIVACIALVCGAGFIVVVGDLAICGLILWLIFKLFNRKKEEDQAQ